VLKCVTGMLAGALLLTGGMAHAQDGEVDLLQSCVNGRVSSLQSQMTEVSTISPVVMQRLLKECQLATGVTDARRACVAGHVAQRTLNGNAGRVDSAALREMEANCG